MLDGIYASLCNSVYCVRMIPVYAAVVFSSAQHAVAQTGPGGVGNSSTNKIWLKADEGVLTPTSNARLGLWVDQSGNHFDAIQSIASAKPFFKIDGINGYPSIRFDRTNTPQYFELTSAGIRNLITANHTMFVVGKANSGSINNTNEAFQAFLAIPAYPNYHSTIGVSGHPTTTSAFMNHWVGVWHNGRPTRSMSISTPATQDEWNIFTKKMSQNSNGATQSGYLNGHLFGTSSDALLMANYSPNLLRVGAAHLSPADTWALNGEVSEIIAYNKALSDVERVLVENYLASKYNLAIENDKYAFDSQGEFPHEVSGIGRTDVNNVHQSSWSDILNLVGGESLGDDDFILFGHNGEPPAFKNTDSPAGLKRLDRVWKFDISGTPEPVAISIATNQFALSSDQNVFLLVDDDGEFSNADIIAGSITNGIFTPNSNVSIVRGSQVTLACDLQPSPPVSLSYEPAAKLLIYGDTYTTPLPIVGDDETDLLFSLLNAPDGISIDSGTGGIHVDGASVGTYSLTVLANNSYGTGTFENAYTITIYPFVANSFSYPDRTVSLGNVIEGVKSNLPANAYQYAVTAGSLNGLFLDPNSGEITGSLNSAVKTSLTIVATPKAPNATGNPLTTNVRLAALGSTGPGGVGDAQTNKVWLDASAMTNLPDGARLSSFTDRSGNGWDAAQSNASSMPTYLINQLNGKPVVRFDRSTSVKSMTITSPGVASLMSGPNTLLILAKANAGARSSASPLQSLVTIPGFHSGMYFLGYPNTTGAFFRNFVGGTVYGETPTTAITSSGSLSQGTWQLLTRRLARSRNVTTQEGFRNGAPVGNPVSNSLMMTKYNTDLIRFGAGNLTGTESLPLHGDIAEVIFYNAALNDAQKVIIENYLASKYNLAIENKKYTSTDYSMDVQGIGTTDGTSSNTHSKSANSKGLQLQELNTTLDAENEFIFAGHNLETNSTTNTDVPTQLSLRWERIWYLEKSGEMDAKITFDISDGGFLAPTSLGNEYIYYRLLYRPSASGMFTMIEKQPALENNDQITFSLLNSELSTGFYTLGTSQGLMWSGLVDEEWNEPANWNLNRIPTEDDHIVINSCTKCPRLSDPTVIAGLQASSGAVINLANNTLSVTEACFLNDAAISSDGGKIASTNFLEMKNCVFRGSVILEKTGGESNACYGGNIFSTEVKVINSSEAEWQISVQSANKVSN